METTLKAKKGKPYHILDKFISEYKKMQKLNRFGTRIMQHLINIGNWFKNNATPKINIGNWYKNR